ncbi:NarK family nitrate/nitrite MFS transporter [Uliginosibacterium flavum]|uniref:Nitrate/nitrite transporter n=1 Tax=Uliginosibacterium flavum TaxID=1396831 RepID=A0ABV2TQ60_9RHOO
MSTHVLTRWEPESQEFWHASGKQVARRNLWLSIPALTLAFSVWMVWSMVVVNLPNVGFKFTTDQLFWLAALPALSGATLRIFYSFLVPIVGGRRWTTISTVSLLIPALGIGIAVQDINTSYPVMLMLALLCGFGGGNFSSSMANISFFYPKSEKGTALGLNAGLGNLGVSIMQFVVPVVIGFGLFGALGGEAQTWIKGDITKTVWLQNAAFVWVPFIVVSAVFSWFGMNDIADAKASFAEQAVIFKRPHNWIMCWLYTGTFGSFIGFSAAFAMLTKTEFPAVDPTALAFLGPLVGALTRPAGGWFADKVGGARVTFWIFILMAAAVWGVIQFLPHAGVGGEFSGFLAMFVVLFALSGIGNGSTFRMIPVIFLTERTQALVAQRGPAGHALAAREAAKESAAALGFAAAIGAYGGFFIPKSFGTSIATTGSVDAALWCFIAFYLSCVVITWWCYSRRNAAMPC